MKGKLEKSYFFSALFMIIITIMLAMPVVADSVEGLIDTTVQYHNWRFTPDEVQKGIMDQYWGKEMTIGELLEKIAPDEFTHMDDLLKAHAYDVNVNWDTRDYGGQRNPYELMMGVTTAYSRIYDEDTAPLGTPESISPVEQTGVPCPIEDQKEQEMSVSLQGSFGPVAPALQFISLGQMPAESTQVKTSSTGELPGSPVSALMGEMPSSLPNQKGFAVNGLNTGCSTEVHNSIDLSFLTNTASSGSGDWFPSDGFVP